MKIAIISTKPFSLESGTEVRNYYLLNGLKKRYDVRFYSPIIPNKLLSQYSLLNRISILLQGKIPYIEMKKSTYLAPNMIEEIKMADIIQLQELESFFAVEKHIHKFSQPIVLDAHNVEFIRFLSGTETEGLFIKWLGRLLANKIKKMEIESLEKIDYILTCSKADKLYFSQYFSARKIVFVPNGVNSDYIAKKKLSKNNNILFMGLLSYGPNNDGIRYYLDEIHNLITTKVENTKVTIIGRNPPSWLLERAKYDSSIEVKGFVKDMRPELDKANVCICPLRFGSGTRLKILEYMSAGKPVVSTSKGFEGIDIARNKHLFIADDPKSFASKVRELLTNHELAQTIGDNARNFVHKNYDWQKITDDLSNFYEQLIRK